MTDEDLAEAARGFITLITGSEADLDEEVFAELAGQVTTEGGPYRLLQLVGAAVGMTKELIHELAVATGRTEEEILQEKAAHWASR